MESFMSIILEFAQWLDLNEARRFNMGSVGSAAEGRQAGRDANEIVTCILSKKLGTRIRDYPPRSTQDLAGIDARFLDGEFANQNLQIQARASHAAQDDFAISLAVKEKNVGKFLGNKITDIIKPNSNAEYLTKWHQKTAIHALMSADDNMIYLAKWEDLESLAMKAFENWENNHNNVIALTISLPKPVNQMAGALVPQGHQEKDPDKLQGSMSIAVIANVDGKDIEANADFNISSDVDSTIQSIKNGFENILGEGSVIFVKKVPMPFRLRYIVKFKEGIEIDGDPVWNSIKYENNEPIRGLRIYFEAPHGKSGTFNTERDTFVDPETHVTVRLTRSTQGSDYNQQTVYNPMVFIPAKSVPTKQIPITQEDIDQCKEKPEVVIDTRNDMEKAEDEANEKGQGTVKIMSTNPKNIKSKQEEIEKFARRNNLNVSWPDKKDDKNLGNTAIYTKKA